MTTYERTALLLSVALVLVGIKADIACPAAHWFVRSGALVTLVAIVFASLDLRKRLASAPTFVEEQLDCSRASIRQQGTANGLDDAECDELETRVVSEIRQEVQAEVTKANKRVLRVELILFIVGTVIWGFGDLATDWLAIHT
jgi:hypothetical protein